MPTTYRFTGQREEASLGLYYYNARWYDSALGHFLSPDTLVPEAGNALDYHRYAYVRFNPLKYNDPSGHICIPVINIGDTCDAPTNWDAVQSSLDVAGVADPTPLSDGVNAVISVVRGNWTDAGLSALGMVPYLGDLAKGASMLMKHEGPARPLGAGGRKHWVLAMKPPQDSAALLQPTSAKISPG
jgi:RHS repeat-associated protein